jgi:regulator of protease activity HflC (stomatin/prohibitin superfamily)
METLFIVAAVIIALLLLSLVLVKQGHIGVVTRFGKYHRMMSPGIHFKFPFIDNVFSKISIQHRSIELEFEAISLDQASVNFKSLILFSAKNSDEDTIKKIAFRFIDEKSFMQTLIRSIEGSIRAFVATKRQSEILVLRQEIVDAVKDHLEDSLNHWGFHLLDLQINDISFDEAIMRSMSQVVSSNNMKAAAENEAQAQYLIKTRAAEAEARSIRVKAEAERDALELKGVGNALFREQVATGLAKAGTIMDAGAVDPALMLYTQWLDTMKNVAAHSHGNILSFDGSNDGFDKTFKQMQLINKSLLEKTNH